MKDIKKAIELATEVSKFWDEFYANAAARALTLEQIDDMAGKLQKYRDNELSLAYEAPVIITSQNPVNVWHGLMPNPAIADAILDRLVHAAIRIELKGDSMRKKKAAELDSEPVKES